MKATVFSLAHVSSGQPIFPNGVRLVDPISRILAGEQLDHVALDYGVGGDEVLMAIRTFAAAQGYVAGCRRWLEEIRDDG